VKIIWSKKSLNDYEEILDYLLVRKSKKEFKLLTEGVEKALKHITIQPFLYPVADPAMPEVRKAVITKRTSLYYKSNKEVVEILAFFDTRQDPDKLRMT